VNRFDDFTERLEAALADEEEREAFVEYLQAMTPQERAELLAEADQREIHASHEERREEVSEPDAAVAFGEVFEAVKRVIKARGERFPGESLVTYREGDLNFSRTATNEYEIEHKGEVVFRAGATGGLSSAPAFKPGGWVAEALRIDKEIQDKEGGK
jgi:hypothetical protein